MKLISISSNKESFKEVNFKKGFNIVLAENTEFSKDKDSRNGLGKTTLIEVIHFCLGSDLNEKKTLASSELEDWNFTLVFQINSKEIKVTRSIEDHNLVKIEGEVHQWFGLDPSLDNIYSVSVNEWKNYLGEQIFNISKESSTKKYTPTFRSIISYYARIGLGAFENPFKYFPQQSAWQKQVTNSFLLDLNWEYAREFQLLKSREKAIQNITKAKNEGVFSELIGSEGELEAMKVNVERNVTDLENQLESFEVHPEYEEIKKDADRLTESLHEIINDRNINRGLLNDYQNNIEEESPQNTDEVLSLYESFGIEFPNATMDRIENVLKFHNSIISNRRDYLEAEISRLESKIDEQSKKIESLSKERAKHLSILESHGALDEYSSLQNRLNEKRQELNKIVEKLELLDDIENQKLNLKIQLNELILKTRQDLKERRKILERAISFFNDCSQYLYSEAGTLSVDVSNSGYKFEVDIKRAKSEGYGKMKIFSYDFTFLELGLERGKSCSVLIHDSIIFDGVDERQIAKALEFAAKKSEDLNIQYICTLNSDMVPEHLFDDYTQKVFSESIVLTLKDDVPENSLLGIRF
jgi:uncharacterized protein YydD (DUF2326 family)